LGPYFNNAIPYGGVTPVFVDIFKNASLTPFYSYPITNLTQYAYNNAYIYTEVPGTYTYTLKVRTSVGSSPGVTTNSITI
jgi:hypothetical protein